MKAVNQPYPEQFAITPDLLHVAIPRVEIVAEMAVRGEHETLNDVCIAVAVAAEAIGSAMTDDGVRVTLLIAEEQGDAVAALSKAGLQMEAEARDMDMIIGIAPTDKLEQITLVDGVRRVEPVTLK